MFYTVFLPQISPIMWESFILFSILIILVTVIYISSVTINLYRSKYSKNNEILKFSVNYFW